MGGTRKVEGGGRGSRMGVGDQEWEWAFKF